MQSSPLPHGLDYFNRQHTYAWFNRWLKGKEVPIAETELDVFPEKLLNARTTGQITTSLNGRPSIQVNLDRLRLLPKSPLADASADRSQVQQNLRSDLALLLGIPSQRSALGYQRLSSHAGRKVIIEEFQFESAPGLRIPGWFVKPSSNLARYPTILFISDDCGNGIVEEPGSMDCLLTAGYAVCAISLRGLGISEARLPKGGPNYYHASVPVNERYSWAWLTLGMPVIGQRVWDITRTIDFLCARPDVNPSQLRLLGKGSAGLAAQKQRIAQAAAKLVSEHQGVLHDADSTTTMIARALRSFFSLTMITNAIDIARELVETNFEVLVTGGVHYGVTPTHWLAHRPKRHCAISMSIIFFLGADGFDPDVGMMAHSFLESHVNRAMVRISRKVVAVCDSTKFSLALIVRAAAVHTVITDTGISPADMEALQNADIEVEPDSAHRRPCSLDAQPQHPAADRHVIQQVPRCEEIPYS